MYVRPPPGVNDFCNIFTKNFARQKLAFKAINAEKMIITLAF
jgi:hypothetical protein